MGSISTVRELGLAPPRPPTSVPGRCAASSTALSPKALGASTGKGSWWSGRRLNFHWHLRRLMATHPPLFGLGNADAHSRRPCASPPDHSAASRSTMSSINSQYRPAGVEPPDSRNFPSQRPDGVDQRSGEGRRKTARSPGNGNPLRHGIPGQGRGPAQCASPPARWGPAPRSRGGSPEASLPPGGLGRRSRSDGMAHPLRPLPGRRPQSSPCRRHRAGDPRGQQARVDRAPVVQGVPDRGEVLRTEMVGGAIGRQAAARPELPRTPGPGHPGRGQSRAPSRGLAGAGRHKPLLTPLFGL